MKVLLSYLIGAASAFLVQFLIQFYVVPRVQTRKAEAGPVGKGCARLGRVAHYLPRDVRDEGMEGTGSGSWPRPKPPRRSLISSPIGSFG